MESVLSRARGLTSRLSDEAGRLWSSSFSIRTAQTTKPDDALSIPPGYIPQVTVSCFNWCGCKSEIHGEAHLSIRTSSVPIFSAGRAIAISYAIGDFDREHHVFGHYDSDATTLVCLQLGAEWSIPDFKTSLVKLSESYGHIWLDQLSVPQHPELIALYLQIIPYIYRNLEVVILWPTAPCPCLETCIQAYKNGDQKFTSAQNGDLAFLEILEGCFNSMPVSSYHFRLWTRQEFLYARRVSLFFCGPPPDRCSRDAYSWGNSTRRVSTGQRAYLNTWATWKYRECATNLLDNGEWSEETVWGIVRSKYISGVLEFMETIGMFYMVKDPHQTLEDLPLYRYLVTSFLLGNKLEREECPAEYIIKFGPLQNGTQLASDHKDFVLAVMPQSPLYRIPKLWKTMTLPELLEDGLLQDEQNAGHIWQTTLPKGLFSSGPGSLRCLPSQYLNQATIQDVGDVYGSITGDSYYPVTPHGAVMLHVKYEPRPASSRMAIAITYKTAFGHESTLVAHNFMKRVGRLAQWNRSRSERRAGLQPWAKATIQGQTMTKEDSWPSAAHEIAMFKEMFYARDYDWDGLGALWDRFPELDHEAACFEMMCNSLGIDSQVAKEKKFGLVVTLTDPPAIGFVNSTVYETLEMTERFERNYGNAHGTAPPEVYHEVQSHLRKNWLSVCATDRKIDAERIDLLVLEVEKQHGDFDQSSVDQTPKQQAIPTYAVKGIWCECAAHDPYIGADLADDWDECNAMLV